MLLDPVVTDTLTELNIDSLVLLSILAILLLLIIYFVKSDKNKFK